MQWKHDILTGMWLFRFVPEFRISDFFCRKIDFWDSRKNEEKIEGDLLFTFILLNRGVPVVEIIYFILIEQKK